MAQAWKHALEDNLLFLAGSVAFATLLAGVPFLLLVASSVGFIMGGDPGAPGAEVERLVTRVFPHAGGVAAPLLENVLADIQRTRRTAGVLGAVTFVWFSTRLFGTLRTALVVVFDVDRPRGVMAGKLYDAWHAVAFTALSLVWLTLSTALAVLSPSGAAVAAHLGFDPTAVDGVAALLARATAVAFLFAAFYALFTLLPNRRVAGRSAAIGAAATTVGFEAAREAFGFAVAHLRPASLYSGSLAAVVIVVLWIYYAAIVVLAGAEVARAHELATAPAAP